jgi:hypothetical protein
MASMHKVTSNLDIFGGVREQWRTVIRPLILGGKRTIPKFDSDVIVVKNLMLRVWCHDPNRTRIINVFVDNDKGVCSDDILTATEPGPVQTAVLQKLRVELGCRIEADICIRASEFLKQRMFTHKG